ncbi:MAG: hypothetical protein II419_05715, partial [Acidaminococcaceae bacterium]|nr:hypothetical protein [Acidaminococcaceae bacterium]
MDLAVEKRFVFTDFGRSMLKQQVIRIREEAGRCLLCHEPKCSEACPHGVD